MLKCYKDDKRDCSSTCPAFDKDDSTTCCIELQTRKSLSELYKVLAKKLEETNLDDLRA